jgi:hypothetical protein
VSFPDYFADRTKRWLHVAKRLLTRSAIEVGRAMALARLPPHVLSSRAKTLDELKRELRNLSDGIGLCVPIRDYSPDLRNELWRASPHMSQQFGCSAEYRPDGCLWFVKRRL